MGVFKEEIKIKAGDQGRTSSHRTCVLGRRDKDTDIHTGKTAWGHKEETASTAPGGPSLPHMDLGVQSPGPGDMNICF